MEKIISHPLFLTLKSLELPPTDFAVFGSTPMYLHGLRPKITDFDLIAVDRAWEIAANLSSPVPAKLGGFHISLEGGLIEMFDSWAPGEWDIRKLITEAEVVGGVNFVTLPSVLVWKRLRNDAKDLADIQKLEAYLKVA